MATPDTEALMVTFQTVPGSRFRAVDAEIIGPYLYELAERLGYDFDGLPAEAIVADAERPESPLHEYFEWNDSIAAREYRLEQARHIARSFQIVYTPVTRGEQTSFVLPAFRSVRLPGGGDGESDSGRVYIPIRRVMSSEMLMRLVLQEAVRDMRAFVKRYEMLRTLPETSALFAAIELWYATYGEPAPAIVAPTE